MWKSHKFRIKWKWHMSSSDRLLHTKYTPHLLCFHDSLDTKFGDLVRRLRNTAQCANSLFHNN